MNFMEDGSVLKSNSDNEEMSHDTLESIIKVIFLDKEINYI